MTAANSSRLPGWARPAPFCSPSPGCGRCSLVSACCGKPTRKSGRNEGASRPGLPEYRPRTAEQVRRWIAEHRVNAQTLIQPEGAPDWRTLGTFAEFAADLKPVPPPFSAPPPAPTAVAAKASNKVAAGIFGILLGPLG